MQISMTNSLWGQYLKPTQSNFTQRSSSINRNSTAAGTMASQTAKTIIGQAVSVQISGASLSKKFDVSKLPATTPGGIKLHYPDPNYDYTFGGTIDPNVRAKLLDRFANGDTLTEDEFRYMDMGNARDYEEAGRLRNLNRQAGRIGTLIKDNGIDIGADGKFQFEVTAGGKLSVTSGTIDKEQQQKLEDVLNKDGTFQYLMNYHGDTVPNYMSIPKSTRDLNYANYHLEHLLNKHNINVNLSDVKKDSEGKYVGLPDSISDFVNNSPSLDDAPATDYAFLKECLNRVTPGIQSKGLDSVPHINFYYTFDNGTLIANDQPVGNSSYKAAQLESIYNGSFLTIDASINKEEIKPTTEQFDSTQEAAANERKRNKTSELFMKLKMGANLTPEELKFLQEAHPGLYDEAIKANEERESYKETLRNCKSKEDVQKVQMDKLQQKLDDIALAAIMNEHTIFITSDEYKKLPNQQKK